MIARMIRVDAHSQQLKGKTRLSAVNPDGYAKRNSPFARSKHMPRWLGRLLNKLRRGDRRIEFRQVL